MAHFASSYWLRTARASALSRRRLLVAGAGTLGAGLLAACGSSSSNNNTAKPSGAPSVATAAASQATRAGGTPAGAAAAPTAAPKRGGVAVTLFEYDPPTLDVHGAAPSQALWFGSTIYNSLVRYTWNPAWTIAADLATSWEVSPDSLQYTFHLAPNVKWSDGSTFSSADPAFNLQKVTDPSVAPSSGAFGFLLAPVMDQVATPDANTLVLKLKSPFPATLDVLAGLSAKIYKKEIYDQNQQETQYVGTGPFLLKQYTKSQVMEYTRNPNYFKPGLPYLDGLKRINIPTIPAEVSALSTGQIMVNTLWPGLTPSQLKTIQSAAGNKITLQNLPENSMEKVFVNTSKAPFNDQRVRQAINLAIDRQDVLARALEGAGVIGILDPRESGDFAMPLDQVSKLPGFRQPKDQDYGDAKKLLAAAGYANGLDFEFVVRGAASYVAIAQVVQQSLAKAGFRVNLNQVESSAGIVLQNQGKYDMGMVGGGSSFNDPFLSLSLQFAGTNSGYSQLNDPNLQGAVQKGLSTTDPAQRQKMAMDIQNYIATTDTANIPMVWDTSGIVVWNQLHDYQAATDMNQGMDFETAWLSA